MMWLRTTTLLYAFCHFQNVVEADCSAVMSKFGAKLQSFNHCVFKFSLSGGFCLNCTREYLQFHSAVKEFAKVRNNGTECQKMTETFLVDKTFESTNEMWTEAQCPSCYDSTSDFEFEVNNKTKEFAKLRTDWTECLMQNLSIATNVSANESLCRLCQPQYQRLDDLYESARLDGSMAICLDVQHMMNQSRQEWQEHFHCHLQRWHSAANKYLVTVGIGVLLALITVVFYVVSFVVGQRRIRKLRKYHARSEVSDSDQLVRSGTGMDGRSTLG